LVPSATSIAILSNPANRAYETETGELQKGALLLGLRLTFLTAAGAGDIEAAFATLSRQKVDGLFVGSDNLFMSSRGQLAALAARYAVPAVYAYRDYAEVGGLMSYGASITDSARQVGVYTGRILKGARPADLPVMQATRLEFIINLQTARALGLTVPPTLLAIADEVIE
jgi:putative ABC transport system substrate-binding protein